MVLKESFVEEYDRLTRQTLIFKTVIKLVLPALPSLNYMDRQSIPMIHTPHTLRADNYVTP